VAPPQDDPFSHRSGGLGTVHDGVTHAVVPRPVVSGPVIIHNYQPVLVYNFLRVCGVPPFHESRVPVLAVGVEVSCEHRITSPLPNYSLPVNPARCSLSCLPFSVIVDVHTPCHLLSPSCNADYNYVAQCILHHVDQFVGLEIAPLVQRQTGISYKLTHQGLRWHSIGWLPNNSITKANYPTE